MGDDIGLVDLRLHHSALLEGGELAFLVGILLEEGWDLFDEGVGIASDDDVFVRIPFLHFGEGFEHILNLLSILVLL